jgi:hypothetical protein
MTSLSARLPLPTAAGPSIDCFSGDTHHYTRPAKELESIPRPLPFHRTHALIGLLNPSQRLSAVTMQRHPSPGKLPPRNNAVGVISLSAVLGDSIPVDASARELNPTRIAPL